MKNNKFSLREMIEGLLYGIYYFGLSVMAFFHVRFKKKLVKEFWKRCSNCGKLMKDYEIQALTTHGCVFYCKECSKNFESIMLKFNYEKIGGIKR